MPSAVIYTRVSTDEQGNSTLGLQAQESACKQYCESAGLEVVATFMEVVSGKSDLKARAIFMQALNAALKTDSVLVIAKQDRLSRDEYIWHGFINKKTFRKTPQLIITDNPNASSFELSIRAAISAEERKLISERTKRALAVLKSQGVELGKAGRAALAAKRNDTTEAKRLIVKLREEGWSYRLIALQLNKKKLFNSFGKEWTFRAVERAYRKLEL